MIMQGNVDSNMNTELENCVRAFIKANVRRIQIALTFAIIRSKPPGLTAVEYAASIQAQARLKYASTEVSDSECSNNSTLCEYKVLFLQQKYLLTRLWEVLPESCSLDPALTNYFRLLTGNTKVMFDSEDSSSQKSCVTVCNTDEMLMKKHEFNLEFIQSMIQLKSIIGTSTHVSVFKLQDVFSDLSANRNNINSETQSYNSESFMSTLSSISTEYSEARLTSRNEVNSSTVSNDVLKYIIHSADTNKLLVNSVKAILHYLGRNILIDDDRILNSVIQKWKGSIPEYSLNIVLELVDTIANQGKEQNECSLACFSFIQDTADGIFSSNSLNKHLIWRQQCSILVEFGNSKCLCVDFLDFLINNLQITAVKLNEKKDSKNMKNEDSLDCNSDDVEKSFYLFYMIENLLKKWKNCHSLRKDNSYEVAISEVQTTSVADLWRSNWSKRDSTIHETAKQNHKTKLVEWRDTFENMIIGFSQYYPFLVYYTWNCLEILKSCLDINV